MTTNSFLALYSLLVTIVCAWLLATRHELPDFDIPQVVTITDTVRDTVQLPPRIIRIPLDVPPADTLGPRRLSYTFDVSDSLIDGTFQAVTADSVFEASFEYVPKFPKYIETTTTVTNTVTIPMKVDVPASWWFVGTDAGINTRGQPYVSAVAGRALASGRLIYYRYDPYWKSHHVGLSLFSF